MLATLPANVFWLNPDLTHRSNLRGILPSGVPLVLLLLIVGTVSFMMFLAGLAEYRTSTQLTDAGESTQGEIISRLYDAMNGRTLTAKYFVTYRFNVPGTADSFAREQPVTKMAFDDLKEGSQVAVKYLASDPAISSLAMRGQPNDMGASAYILAVIGLLGTLVTAVFLLPRLVTLWQDQRLRQHGRIILGRVLSCRRFVSETSTSLNPNEYGSALKSNFFIELSYSFPSPEGKLIRTSVRRKRNDLFKCPLPTFGVPVAVLYLDDSHYNVL